MDKIIIKDLLIHGILGIYPHERKIPQSILINITVYTDISRAAQTDDIADCVDYDALAKKIKQHAETAARLTVEALANDIAQLCLNEPGVERATIRIEKPDAIPYTASVGVEIERHK